ncbi:MAG TPA: NAD(P)-dependent oxidoreductase, partial [Verrucomicrobiales bacterium]|nr:NAD(P)-dependent oxidoreductase [Verrucomicrobiales bacterium]
MRVLIIGCGYIGFPLATELVRQGHEVTGVGRHATARPELAEAGIRPLDADVTQPETLSKIGGPFDWVVNCVSSSQGGLDDYRNVYLDGTRNLISWLTTQPPAKFLYTSSTGVYGQDNGSVVKEDHPTEPATETAQVLAATEQLLLSAARERKFPAIILRVAGIYGPARTFQLSQFLENRARVEGRGERHLNMIHRDDVVGSIIAALRNGRPGEVYNAVDDEPVQQVHFLRWLSETLGKWMPPAATPEELADLAKRKRGVTNKKVSNRRLKMELGYQLKFPTFRQGYTAEIRRL